MPFQQLAAFDVQAAPGHVLGEPLVMTARCQVQLSAGAS